MILNEYTRSCVRKRPYESQAQADAVIKTIRKRGKQVRFTGLRSYHCRFCDHWHVGHGKRKK